MNNRPSHHDRSPSEDALRTAVIAAVLVFALIAALVIVSTMLGARTAGAAEPRDIAVSDDVGLIEVNHYYDDRCNLVFDQVIFYDWSPAQGRYLVRAWRLLKSPSQIPQPDLRGTGYVAVWHDGDYLRRVWCAVLRETWTQHDPELASREFFPKECRSDLAVGRAAIKRAHVVATRASDTWGCSGENLGPLGP